MELHVGPRMARDTRMPPQWWARQTFTPAKRAAAGTWLASPPGQVVHLLVSLTALPFTCTRGAQGHSLHGRLILQLGQAKGRAVIRMAQLGPVRLNAVF